MKFVSLLSSGIDSPVATYQLSRKGEDMILIHADNRPYSDKQEIENFKALAGKLQDYITGNIEVYVIPHGESLAAYMEGCSPRFVCIFCKRMILRYAESLARKTGADAVIMGDSLGQVASQTLQNIYVIEQAIQLPVLRPLIGRDKEEIVTIAKDIETYDLSIQASAGCSAVPRRPATQTRLDAILKEESKLDIAQLVENAVDAASLLRM